MRSSRLLAAAALVTVLAAAPACRMLCPNQGAGSVAAVASPAVAGAPAGREAAPGISVTSQPAPAAWAAYNRAGYRTVVNFRTPEEGAYAEQDLVVGNGMSYVNIPVQGAAVSAADADALAKVLASPGAGRVLLHCSTGNRAAGVWAVYCARHLGMTVDQALAAGDAAGITKSAVRDAARKAITGE